jgi:hypothetical protein
VTARQSESVAERCVQDLDRNREVGSDSANENGDRVLKLGACHAKVRRGGLRILQGVLSLDHGDLIGDSGVVLRAVVVQRFLVRDNRVVEELYQRILSADFEDKRG